MLHANMLKMTMLACSLSTSSPDQHVGGQKVN